MKGLASVMIVGIICLTVLLITTTIKLKKRTTDTGLALEAYVIFRDMLSVKNLDSLDNDILSEDTRTKIDKWREKFRKAHQ